MTTPRELTDKTYDDQDEDENADHNNDDQENDDDDWCDDTDEDKKFGENDDDDKDDNDSAKAGGWLPANPFPQTPITLVVTAIHCCVGNQESENRKVDRDLIVTCFEIDKYVSYTRFWSYPNITD